MEKILKLIDPSIEYEEAFKRFVLSYKEFEEMKYFDMYKEALENYKSYIGKLKNQSKGLDLPEGWMPSSTFWLTDSEEILGVIRIRHSIDNEYLKKYAGHIGYDISPKYRKKGYGTKILGYGLVKARELGIERVLVTCVSDNIGSMKIIEKNGGVFENEVYDMDNNELIRRYWIDIK